MFLGTGRRRIAFLFLGLGRRHGIGSGDTMQASDTLLSTLTIFLCATCVQRLSDVAQCKMCGVGSKRWRDRAEIWDSVVLQCGFSVWTRLTAVGHVSCAHTLQQREDVTVPHKTLSQ